MTKEKEKELLLAIKKLRKIDRDLSVIPSLNSGIDLEISRIRISVLEVLAKYLAKAGR